MIGKFIRGHVVMDQKDFLKQIDELSELDLQIDAIKALLDQHPELEAQLQTLKKKIDQPED